MIYGTTINTFSQNPLIILVKTKKVFWNDSFRISKRHFNVVEAYLHNLVVNLKSMRFRFFKTKLQSIQTVLHLQATGFGICYKHYYANASELLENLQDISYILFIHNTTETGDTTTKQTTRMISRSDVWWRHWIQYLQLAVHFYNKS